MCGPHDENEGLKSQLSHPTFWENYMPDYNLTVAFKSSFLRWLTSKCCFLQIQSFMQVRIKALTLLHDLMLEVEGLGNLVKEAGICQVQTITIYQKPTQLLLPRSGTKC